MSQHNQGRNNENTQTDEVQISVCAGLFFDRGVQKSHASNTEKGDIRRHVKVTLKKLQLFKLNVNRREKSI